MKEKTKAKTNTKLFSGSPSKMQLKKLLSEHEEMVRIDAEIVRDGGHVREEFKQRSGIARTNAASKNTFSSPLFRRRPFSAGMRGYGML